jgi:hypothetical protein
MLDPARALLQGARRDDEVVERERHGMIFP